MKSDVTGRLPADWDSLIAEHAAAVGQFASAVQQLPSGAWNRPLTEGKWTPAEITSHLAESYRILRSELRGEPGMALRLSRLRCWLLRHMMLPRILASGRFPAGARAPRETRPRDVVHDVPAALLALTTEAEAFNRELTAQAGTKRIHLTHAYFGPMSARQSLQLVTVHTRHHTRQLTSTP